MPIVRDGVGAQRGQSVEARVKCRSEGKAPEPGLESEGQAPEEEDGARTSGDQIGAQACRILAPDVPHFGAGRAAYEKQIGTQPLPCFVLLY